jgi:DNA polymerase-4
MRTVGDIARADLKHLAARLGSSGLRLHALAHGRDTRAVDPEQIRKSISAETTFEHDLKTFAELDDRLTWLAEKVARQARAGNLAGRVVTLKLRGNDFKILTRRKALVTPTQTARTILAVGRELLTQELKSGAPGRQFRLVGVGITELAEPGAVEDDFFGGDERRTLAGEKTADAIRARFGADAVTSARALKGKSSAQD